MKGDKPVRKTFTVGPNDEAIPLEKVDPEIVGPNDVLKKEVWNGKGREEVATEIGKALTHCDIAAKVGEDRYVYLGHLKANKVSHGHGVVIFNVDGRYFGEHGEVSICTGCIRVEFTTKEEQDRLQQMKEEKPIVPEVHIREREQRDDFQE